MKTCYTIRIAHKIAIADLTEMFEGIYEINRINVPAEHRGRRRGSQLLSEICRDADSDKIILMLYPVPSGGLCYEDLVRWYVRYGFYMTNKGMVRVPRG